MRSVISCISRIVYKAPSVDWRQNYICVYFKTSLLRQLNSHQLSVWRVDVNSAFYGRLDNITCPAGSMICYRVVCPELPTKCGRSDRTKTACVTSADHTRILAGATINSSPTNVDVSNWICNDLIVCTLLSLKLLSRLRYDYTSWPCCGLVMAMLAITIGRNSSYCINENNAYVTLPNSWRCFHHIIFEKYVFISSCSINIHVVQLKPLQTHTDPCYFT